jgi:hypothetical protein
MISQTPRKRGKKRDLYVRTAKGKSMQIEEQHGQCAPLRFFEYRQEIGAAHEHQGCSVVQHVEEVDDGWLVVAGLLTVFGYYASSICITVVLAGFLAILFDPVVVKLEKLPDEYSDEANRARNRSQRGPIHILDDSFNSLSACRAH